MISHIGMQKNPWKDLTVLWIDERLQIAAITTGGFLLKYNYVLDEEEYILKIEVETLHPTVQVENSKGMEWLMFIFWLWLYEFIAAKNREVIEKRKEEVVEEPKNPTEVG